MKNFDPIKAYLNENIASQIINGGVVYTGPSAESENYIAGGFADFKHQNPFRFDTVIDLASVTKVTATVTALLRLHYLGKVDFEAPFTDYLPEFQPRLNCPVSVRNLANHTSGFAEVPGEETRRYFAESGNVMLQNVLKLPPPFAPGGAPNYSCWNYILLALIIEKISGQRFDDFCRDEIFIPLGMNESSLGKAPQVAPERLAQTMGTLSPGQISDRVAYRIYRDGNCTGNAGMFSTAGDLGKLLGCYLRHGEIDAAHRLFGEAEFLAIAPDCASELAGYRRLGWVVYEAGIDRANLGHSLWHSGWSGQSIFLNFQKNFYIIVLTSRCGDYANAKATRFNIINNLAAQY